MAASKPKLLVIPHQYSESIRVRGLEFARHLVPHFEVLCLSWPDMLLPGGASASPAVMRRFRAGVAALRPSIRLSHTRGGVQYLRAPYVQTPLLSPFVGVPWAFRLSRTFNVVMLRLLLNRLKPDVALIGNGTFWIPRMRGVRKVFDWCDWYDEDKLTGRLAVDSRNYVLHLKSRADGMVAVSETLRRWLRDRYGIAAAAIPNGVDLAAFRGVPVQAVQRLRRSLGLDRRFVVGAVGQFGAKSGIEFLAEFLLALRRRVRDAALLVVGPVPAAVSAGPLARDPNVHFVGSVPPADVPAYVHAMDVTLLPKRRSLETDMAFHIKAVEYSACRKPILSTPLQSVRDLDWPHVLVADPDPEVWAAEALRARRMTWVPAWDRLVEPYDWSKLAKGMADYLRGVEEHA